MATLAQGTSIVPSGTMTYPGAIQSRGWQTIHADAEATAETTHIDRPTSSGLNAGVRYVKVPEGAVRAQIRVQYQTGATVTTSPVVRVYGLNGTLSESGVATEGDGSIWAQRLDSISNGTGITLVMDSANDITDGTYQWSAVLENGIDGSPWVDLQGSSWVTVLVETAANATGASLIQVKFLN